MLTRISVVAWALLAAVGVNANASDEVLIDQGSSLPADSDIGRNLLHRSRRAANYYNNNNNYQQQYNDQQQQNWAGQDTSFLGSYSVVFQGCHHVQQWNENAEDEEDVRIMTKRLVRYRLCPTGSCGSDLGGCTSKYGDYVVDMGTYLSAFYAQMYQNGNRQLAADMGDYLTCSEFDMRRHLQNNNYYYQQQEDVKYYIGPYCADQGGEIRLGIFTDDTCTSFSQYGESMYKAAKGYALPYSQSSLVTGSCIGCSSYDGGAYGVSEFCSDIYALSGKCETKMAVYYPNEQSCSYIEGIKIIREDGVIRTSSTRKSKAASVAIGCFLTIAVLLAGYVYYLRTKLGRAKINLAAASQTLG